MYTVYTGTGIIFYLLLALLFQLDGFSLIAGEGGSAYENPQDTVNEGLLYFIECNVCVFYFMVCFNRLLCLFCALVCWTVSFCICSDGRNVAGVLIQAHLHFCNIDYGALSFKQINELKNISDVPHSFILKHFLFNMLLFTVVFSHSGHPPPSTFICQFFTEIKCSH